MLIEFYSVRADYKESYEREVLLEMGSTPAFECKEDYLAPITVDMDNVRDFSAGRVYMNGEPLDCVYVRCYEDIPLAGAILLEYKSFKKLFEAVRGTKIPSYTEYLPSEDITV